MLKKLLLSLLVIVTLFTISGCGKEDKEMENKIDDDTVVLENITYKLNQEDEEYGLKYNIADNFRKTSLINAINYFSENINDQPYFVIRIFYYQNKSIDYAINDSTESYDKKWEETINDLDYTAVHFINYTKADVNIYYHKNQNDVYAFVFTSGIDISRLKDIFLKSVIYPEK